MISIDHHPPPDPSSSDYQNHHHHHHQQQLLISAHEAPVSDIDLLKPTDANLDDINNPLHSFSIRDYVFNSRSKDITCNWPFSRESLQLCLQYGVKNLLPPFQSLSRCGVENRIQDEEIIISFDGISTDDQLESQENLARINSEKPHLDSIQPTFKNCKFVMKLNSGVEPNKETMASKVCPVCKTFSSSSNTTLNAHIDRCLSEESSIKWTANPKQAVKHSIKPRKTRLMVDIYKTAPRCTVEELDRRNGTSWATNSNFPDQELEFQAEEKKNESQEPTLGPEVADHEGAVYIDTNGTKVRILSMPNVGILNDRQARKLHKGGKGSKIVAEKKIKETYELKKGRKVTKLSPDSKNFRALKPHFGASEEIENLAIEESCSKEDEGENPIKARVRKQMDDLAIKRPPLAFSKRTDLTKKFNGVTKDSLIPSSSENMSFSRRCKKARTSSRSVCREQPLTVNSFVKFSSKKRPKEGTLLRDICDDPPVIRSKSSKIPSLKKNLLSTSLENKFLAPKKTSRAHCSSLESAVVEPSQDSSKQKSIMEERKKEKLSFEMENVLEVQKKSISNADSSGGLEIPLESSRDEVPSHSDHIRTDFPRSFMGLRHSLDDEFSNTFQFYECQEMHQGTLDLIKNNVEYHMDDIENQGTCFHEVDPIPIPGPPGSFLPPSPGGDMESEELQGNSSLTHTSRVQSTEDQHHHDTMKTDCVSDSPISTISSPGFVRSGSRSAYTGVLVDDVDKKSAHIASSDVNTSNLRLIYSEKGLFPSGSYHQESADLRERSLELNMRPSSMNFRSEFFPLINRPTVPPPEPVKLPVYNCESSVSPSTPVLRLMGKNLTVVKTDDDVSSSHQLHNIQNDDRKSFFYGYPYQNGYNPQHFNFHPQTNARSLADHLKHVRALDTIFPSARNGLVAPAEYFRLDHTKVERE